MGHHALPPEAITAAVDDLTRDRSAMSPEAANREVYRLLKEGIAVSVLERDSPSGRAELPLRPNVSGGAATPPYQKGRQTTVRVQVIDWEQPANNDFLLVSQFSGTGALYTCRPDVAGFVNGLPLVVIELQKPGVPARGVRREADALQTAHPGAVLVQRAAHRLKQHRHPHAVEVIGKVSRSDSPCAESYRQNSRSGATGDPRELQLY